jgi:hypothetical protein
MQVEHALRSLVAPHKEGPADIYMYIYMLTPPPCTPKVAVSNGNKGLNVMALHEILFGLHVFQYVPGVLFVTACMCMTAWMDCLSDHWT